MPYSEEEKRQRKNANQREYARRTGYAATAKSQKKNSKTVLLRFYYNTEQDVLDYLESQENKSGYIKNLIREDMKKHSKETPV